LVKLSVAKIFEVEGCLIKQFMLNIRLGLGMQFK